MWKLSRYYTFKYFNVWNNRCSGMLVTRDHNWLLRNYYHKKKSGQTEPKSWTNRKLGRSGIRYPDDPDKRGFKENHAIWTKLDHFCCLEGCSSIRRLLRCWLLRYRIQWLQRSWSWGILLWRNYFNTFRGLLHLGWIPGLLRFSTLKFLLVE